MLRQRVGACDRSDQAIRSQRDRSIEQIAVGRSGLGVRPVVGGPNREPMSRFVHFFVEANDGVVVVAKIIGQDVEETDDRRSGGHQLRPPRRPTRGWSVDRQQTKLQATKHGRAFGRLQVPPGSRLHLRADSTLDKDLLRSTLTYRVMRHNFVGRHRFSTGEAGPVVCILLRVPLKTMR